VFERSVSTTLVKATGSTASTSVSRNLAATVEGDLVSLELGNRMSAPLGSDSAVSQKLDEHRAGGSNSRTIVCVSLPECRAQPPIGVRECQFIRMSRGFR
jgi:hypothetical protein